MEIQGKIIAVLPARGGMSARTGSSWKSQDFVIETHEQYPKKCVFTVFGEDRLNQFNIQLNDELIVSMDVDAHEYNGRWYNDIRAWKVVRASAEQNVGVPQAPVDTAAAFAAEPAIESDPADDLPF